MFELNGRRPFSNRPAEREDVRSAKTSPFIFAGPKDMAGNDIWITNRTVVS